MQTTGPLRARLRRELRTTLSAESHSQAGMSLVSTSIRWWNSDRVKPGQSACACTPVPLSSAASPSLKVVRYALLAQ